VSWDLDLCFITESPPSFTTGYTLMKFQYFHSRW